MFQFFQRHDGNQKIDDPKNKNKPWRDSGRVSWLLWGGDAGKTWSTMLWNRIKREKGKKESIIDHEKPTLNPIVWDLETEKIKPETKKIILKPLFDFFKQINLPLYDIYSINIIGSIGSKRYRPDSDIDVQVLLKPSENWEVEEIIEKIPLINDKILPGTKHPIEYYIETYDNLKTHLFNYDIINDVWINRGEELYIDVDYYRDLIRDKIKDFNDLLFELDSNIIDYEDIKYFANERDPETLRKINNKIEEIKQDMEKIRLEYKKLKEERKTNYSDESIANITYKFLQKYNLLRRMQKVSNLLEDGFQTTDIKKASERFKTLKSKIRKI
jgi:arsenate reductase-like glutaredoxin family protein/predicted nucleotidyltransferase